MELEFFGRDFGTGEGQEERAELEEEIRLVVVVVDAIGVHHRLKSETQTLALVPNFKAVEGVINNREERERIRGRGVIGLGEGGFSLGSRYLLLVTWLLVSSWLLELLQNSSGGICSSVF
ncbi:uncharacterized protein A4U43_C06F16170 [Asparagus officinalis]|uniref:Uncharacterized protein n=1 Tax=Asparagus officinalis TaxID=4686 RepID=A0A5P1ENA0_ASPOF|nr:uncharacterized protein A4U43_C06F16170 [Asparagus officinalis]